MARYVLTGVTVVGVYCYLFDLPFDPSLYDEWRDIAADHLPEPMGIIKQEVELIELLDDSENGKSVLLRFEQHATPKIIATYCGDYPDIGEKV